MLAVEVTLSDKVFNGFADGGAAELVDFLQLPLGWDGERGCQSPSSIF